MDKWVKTGNLERKKHCFGNWGPIERKVLSNLCHERLSPQDKRKSNLKTSRISATMDNVQHNIGKPIQPLSQTFTESLEGISCGILK